MAIAAGAQLILQTEQPDGTFECLGFTGLPVVNPVFIALSSAPSFQARSDLVTLKQALLAEIQLIAPGMSAVRLPCRGNISSPAACHAQSENECQKLLILLGDDTTPISSTTHFNPWLAPSQVHRILPVFPISARPRVLTLLPAMMVYLNAEFWSRSIADTIPTILGVSGLTVENRRIFISYRQKDSAALAIQIFDALSHQGFDVFLDHFRIPPGVNFQARLTQELGDKAMMLLIESEHILESEWTLYEINIAKTCSLGIVALQVPQGIDVPGVDPSIRQTVHDNDFNQGAFSENATLTTSALDRLTQFIKAEHGRVHTRRRRMLHDSLEDALLRHGIALAPVNAAGMFHIKPPGKVEYLVWLTPRPPELHDFHTVHGQVSHPLKGVVVGLSRLMEPVRFAQTNWLAGLTMVKVADEGQLNIIASQIAAGAL